MFDVDRPVATLRGPSEGFFGLLNMDPESWWSKD
jgi:hypothetical protein